jgi:hypothetical protein
MGRVMEVHDSPVLLFVGGAGRGDLERVAEWRHGVSPPSRGYPLRHRISCARGKGCDRLCNRVCAHLRVLWIRAV